MATTTATATVVATAGKKKEKSRKKPLAVPPYLVSNLQTQDADGLLMEVANLLEGRKNIVVLVGAGISTSVGIPDFRSKDKGLYNTLDAQSLGLSCPEDLFCIEFFKSNPRPFYKFAKHLYYPNAKPTTKSSKRNHKTSTQKPTRTSQRIKGRKRPLEEKPPNGRAAPSDSHKLLALLEKRKMLLRVYTQNIDGLEASAGVSDSKIVYCHGSLRSMSCTKCSKKNLPLDEQMLASIEEGSVPVCKIPSHKKKKNQGGRSSSSSSTTSNALEAANPVVSPTRTSKRKKRPRATTMEGYYNDDSDSTPLLVNGEPCCGGVLKPGITFFGETLDNSVGRKIESDQSKADALIVIGTSLSVAPISKVIEYLPESIPRILINRTIVHPKTSGQDSHSTFRKNYVFDAYLLGFCDDVTRALGKQLGLGFNVETKPKPEKTKSSKDCGRTKKRQKTEERTIPTRYASETGAKILSQGNEHWSEISVPRERVLLFPGALSPSEAGSSGEKQQASTEVVPSYQEIAHCDGCSNMIPIGRPIFKCCKCFDYDLCQSCYPRVSKLHCGGKHSFRKE